MTAPIEIGNFTEPVNKLLVPLATSVGNTLQDAWELVFGSFGTYVEKKRLTRQKNLEDFKKSLEEKVLAIPEDRLIEPALSIVGPALEASKYYFEEPEIREMFANLIAASMDTQTASSVHPSFTTIIQQLSPLDAQNLACFCPTNYFESLPIAEYRTKDKQNNSYILNFTNVFLSNSFTQSIKQQSISIANLVQLGLINASYMQTLHDSEYLPFKQTEEFLSLIKTCPVNKRIEIHHGIARLTPVGEAFCSVCLPVK